MGPLFSIIGAAAVAVAAAGWDLKKQRIPNALTYGALLLGLGAQLALAGWRGLLDGAGGGLAAGGIFLVLYALRAMGAGDVKLIAALGCWAGFREALVIVLASAIAGGVLAIFVMVARRRVGQTLRNVGALVRYYAAGGRSGHPEINLQNPEAVKVPYAVAIAAGTLYCLGQYFWRG